MLLIPSFLQTAMKALNILTRFGTDIPACLILLHNDQPERGKWPTPKISLDWSSHEYPQVDVGKRNLDIRYRLPYQGLYMPLYSPF